MAKELPYFRFNVQEWQNGDISLERFELQGLFISVCGFYWVKDCNCTLAMLQKKFSNATNEILELITLGIIKHEKRHDKIEIVFLNNQYDLLSEKRKLRQSAGSMGGNAKAMLHQKGGYKDKDKDNNKDKDKDKDKGTKNVLVEDVILYFEDNKYTKESAVKFFNYYEITNWKDSKGNLVRNWKQKAQAVWFKPENLKTEHKERKLQY